MNGLPYMMKITRKQGGRCEARPKMCIRDRYSPMHFHWSKMEDIINRGGGNVLIRVYNSTKDEDLDKVNDVHVHIDGREMVAVSYTHLDVYKRQVL